jgi:hypothetical protein
MIKQPDAWKILLTLNIALLEWYVGTDPIMQEVQTAADEAG